MHVQVLYKYNSSIAPIFVIKNTIKPILPLKDIPKSQNILNCRQKNVVLCKIQFKKHKGYDNLAI